jgi:CRP-like cAMP-binding protein
MKQSEIGQLLAGVELFSGLSQRDLNRIAKQGHEMPFRAGTKIVEEGAIGGRFFLVLDGEARITVNGRSRGVIRAGGSFGEISLLDGAPRLATVTATTDVSTFTVAKFNFRPLLREVPAFSEKILLELCRLLREERRLQVIA